MVSALNKGGLRFPSRQEREVGEKQQEMAFHRVLNSRNCWNSNIRAGSGIAGPDCEWEEYEPDETRPPRLAVCKRRCMSHENPQEWHRGLSQCRLQAESNGRPCRWQNFAAPACPE